MNETDHLPHEAKVLALIAHDGKKADIVAFATFNREKLVILPNSTVSLGTTGLGHTAEANLDDGPSQRAPPFAQIQPNGTEAVLRIAHILI